MTPTVTDPREVNTHGRTRGHGWVFVEDGAWRVEHCQDGRWGCCSLLIFGVRDDDRAVRDAFLRHMSRKPHRFDFPQRLAGIAHGGGGVRPFVKGPRA